MPNLHKRLDAIGKTIAHTHAKMPKPFSFAVIDAQLGEPDARTPEQTRLIAEDEADRAHSPQVFNFAAIERLIRAQGANDETQTT